MSQSLLLVDFRRFYSEVVSVRQTLMSLPSNDIEGMDDEEGGRLGDFSAGTAHLAQSLKQSDAGSLEDLTAAQLLEVREARYIMAALADEILIHHVGVDPSSSVTLVETHLAGTRCAGDAIFDGLALDAIQIVGIDALLKRPDQAGDLAAVYLLALSLGLRGRMRLFPGGAGSATNGYLQRLSEIVREQRGAAQSSDGLVYPEAYRSVIRGGRPGLPSGRLRWLTILLLSVLAYGVVSTVGWQTMTTELRGDAETLLNWRRG